MDSRIVLFTAFFVLCTYCAHAQAQFTANCTSSGRIANTADTTCQTYFLCVFVAANSSYVGYTYTCPNTAVFNPNSGQCTDPTNYNCTNTNSTTTTSSVCTEDGFVADPSSTDCSTYIQCTQINGTFVETTLTCPATTFYNPNTTLCDASFNCTSSSTFSCTAIGRFPNTADTTCQTYYFCVSSNGTFIQYQYTCPNTSVFNPLSRMCTTTYVCGS